MTTSPRGSIGFAPKLYCIQLRSVAIAPMIFADLPYGTTACHWDNLIDIKKFWEQWLRIAKENAAFILTAQQPFATDLINSNRKLFRYEIIWEKTQKLGFLLANKMPLRGHENILVFYRKLPTYNPQKGIGKSLGFGKERKQVSDRYDGYEKSIGEGKYLDDGSRYPHSVIKISNWNGALFGKNKNTTKHPTQKPVELLDWLIKTYTNEGDTVLDCVMGSGTTGVSCKKNNRNFIGIEKEFEFYELSVSRVYAYCG